MNMDLSEIRKKIDVVDDELLSLFLKRMELSQKVAEYKAENGLPILNMSREREILSAVTKRSGDMAQYSDRLFKTMFQLSRAYQCKLSEGKSELGNKLRQLASETVDVFPRMATVACQGVEGAYSQIACDRLFPMADITFMRSFSGVFDAVENGLCQFGILPVENSSNGSVRSVFSLIQKKRFYIVRSIKQCISHEFLVKPGTTAINEICSHEQALGQCSDFIRTLGDSVKITPVANTAVAAKYASEHEGIAAIASNRCAELYGLTVAKRGIQNSENNYTRFICIAKEPIIYAGANKISLILSCKHEPGSLSNLITDISACGINLTKLESIPIVGRDFEFMFYFDIEASIKEKGVIGMLESLESSCESFAFLGNYSEV